MQQQQNNTYEPDISSLKCSICELIFDKPITLTCGHSFCLSCLSHSFNKNKCKLGNQSSSITIPLCPSCQSIIWKPLSSLKENVVLSNLITRYKLNRKKQSDEKLLSLQSQNQFHIMIKCAHYDKTPLPNCFTQIVFATAFIDEILQQQAQNNFIVLRWEGASENKAIIGRISRPQIYHYSMKASRHEVVFRSTFEGKYFVKVNQWQQIDLAVHSSGQYPQSQIITSHMMLCQIEQIKARNSLQIQQFHKFFQVYDNLNNPVFLRQISQLVNERILHQRNDPEKMIYCIMRVLRLSEKHINELVNIEDDGQRWTEIEGFLIQNQGKPAEQIIKISIPGDYPHSLVFALLLLLLFICFWVRQ